MRVTIHVNESCLKQVATSIVDSRFSANELDCVLWMTTAVENWDLMHGSLTVQCCQNVFISLQNHGWFGRSQSETKKDLLNFTNLFEESKKI